MADPTRVTVNHCATVLGVGWRKAQKVLRRLERIYPADAAGTYDARILDLLRAMRDQPHRELKPVDRDWLSRYMEEISDAPQGT